MVYTGLIQTDREAGQNVPTVRNFFSLIIRPSTPHHTLLPLVQPLTSFLLRVSWMSPWHGGPLDKSMVSTWTHMKAQVQEWNILDSMAAQFARKRTILLCRQTVHLLRGTAWLVQHPCCFCFPPWEHLGFASGRTKKSLNCVSPFISLVLNLPSPSKLQPV